MSVRKKTIHSEITSNCLLEKEESYFELAEEKEISLRAVHEKDV